MTYKYFFFDFDGTIVDSYPHVTASFVAALEETRKTKIDYKKAYDATKISFYEAYQLFHVTEEEAELISKYHRDETRKPLVTLYLGCERLLKAIIESGGKNFIYTNRDMESLVSYLKKFNIYQYFTDFIVEANKPNPLLLNEMIEKYHLDKKDCVVVGDRSLDVDGGYNANVDGILFDCDSRVFLHHGTYVIKRFNELFKFVDLPYFLTRNYHTHTIRCGHAVGEDEEYVIAAIKDGYEVLGFSDHVMIPDLNRDEEYFETISLLKEKYKDQIDIRIGLEVEDYVYYHKYYKELLDSHKVDYLIFGNHSYLDINGRERKDTIYYLVAFPEGKEDLYLNRYYDSMKWACESGLFKYIAHPDVFLKGYLKWDDKAIELAHKIGKLLEDNHLLCEINAQGFRQSSLITYNGETSKAYPFKEFFKILKEYDITYVLGADAHSPNALNDEAYYKAIEFAKELDLKLVNNELYL